VIVEVAAPVRGGREGLSTWRLVSPRIEGCVSLKFVVVHQLIVLMQHRITAAEPCVRVAFGGAIPRLPIQWVVARFFRFVQVDVSADAMFGNLTQILVGRAAVSALVW